MAKKNLRAEMDEPDFHKFKRVMSEMEATTNDEAILELINRFRENERLRQRIQRLEARLERAETGEEVTSND